MHRESEETVRAMWPSERIWDTSETAQRERRWCFRVGGNRSKEARKRRESVAEQREPRLFLCWQYSEISVERIKDSGLPKGREILRE